MRYLLLTSIALTLLASLLSAQTTQEPLGPAFTGGDPAFSSDGQHVAWTTTASGKTQIFLDGKIVGEEDHRVWSLTISDNGKHVAWLARTGQQWRIVHDGKPGDAYDDIQQITEQMALSGDTYERDRDPAGRTDASAVTLSPDGTRAAYVAKDPDGWRVVVDGKPGPTFDAIGTPLHLGIVFSPDSKRIAYIAMRGVKPQDLTFNGSSGEYIAKHKVKWFAVIDGEIEPEYDSIAFATCGGVTFSADSKHVAYKTQTGEQWWVVLNGQANGPYQYVMASRLGPFPVRFSPDGKRWVYTAQTKEGEGRKGGGWQVIVDGKADPQTYKDVVQGSLIFSPDSRRVAYGVRMGQDFRENMVIDGQPCPGKYSWLGYENLAFSPNGKRLAYVAFVGTDGREGSMVVLDDQLGSVYDSIPSYSLLFSPDGQQFVHQAITKDENHKRSYHCVLNGKPGPPYNLIWNMCFSPDSKHFAYTATKWNDPSPSSEFLIKDGEPRLAPEKTYAMTFSPDSKHLVRLVQTGRGFAIILDDQQGPEFDHIHWPKNIFQNGHVSYLAVRDKIIYRVKMGM